MRPSGPAAPRARSAETNIRNDENGQNHEDPQPRHNLLRGPRRPRRYALGRLPGGPPERSAAARGRRQSHGAAARPSPRPGRPAAADQRHRRIAARTRRSSDQHRRALRHQYRHHACTTQPRGQDGLGTCSSGRPFSAGTSGFGSARPTSRCCRLTWTTASRSSTCTRGWPTPISMCSRRRTRWRPHVAAREAIGRQLEQAQKRFEVGLIAITDVQEAQSGYDQAVAAEIVAKRSLANSKEVLREIVGDYPGDLAKPKDEIPLISPAPGRREPVGRGSAAAELSLQSAQLGADIARDNISIARSGHLPTVDFVASHTDNRQRGRSDRSLRFRPRRPRAQPTARRLAIPTAGACSSPCRSSAAA